MAALDTALSNVESNGNAARQLGQFLSAALGQRPVCMRQDPAALAMRKQRSCDTHLLSVLGPDSWRGTAGNGLKGLSATGTN